jgi:glycosyltransferase involved in cell wall biosynthesis
VRILHLDSGREIRGGQWQVLYLLRGLRARGHELKLLARGALLASAKREGFDAAPLSIARISSWAQVIHAHDARSHAVAALRRQFSRQPPLVVSRRVAFPIQSGLLSRWKYRQASHYIAISRFVAGHLMEAGIKSESISVVYDGVPLAPARDARIPGVLVVAPATSDPMKGSDLSREAARLAGVEIVFSEDLSRDLPGAAVFVYVSRSEGLGSAALLAMAHGVPVVASRVGGLVEAVEDGVSGMLAANTPAEIGRAIVILLDHEELRCRMGRAARERVERRFSLDSMVEGTLRVYEKVRA